MVKHLAEWESEVNPIFNTVTFYKQNKQENQELTEGKKNCYQNLVT